MRFVYQFVAICILVIGPAVVSAKFARFGEPVPVPRLLKNVSHYVKENPKDARGHYTLGRLHSIAFAGTKDGIYVEVKDRERNTPLPLPRFGPSSVLIPVSNDKAVLTSEQKAHLVDSLGEYRAALSIAPKEALYWLGYGWMAEQSVRFRFQTESPPYQKLPVHNTQGWRDEALTAYRKAYDLTKSVDSKLRDFSDNNDDSMVSVEAGEGIVRLLSSEKQADKAELKAVKAHLDAMNKKPHWITPIIMGRPGSNLKDLLASRRTVRFDLAGNGRKETWQWVKSGVGILVWDPLHTGRVTSGRQLFGSRTWQMIWRNGYEPLAALDNNHDGVLTGPELVGISVWWDRNGNGVSERGEVVTAQQAGIVSIAVRPESTSGGVPAIRAGIRMSDGRILPTFDWTPQSIVATAAR